MSKRISHRPKALAISWYFAPYVGSADVDFYKRIKELDLDVDVVMAKRSHKDEQLLAYNPRRNINRYEIAVDHLHPRSRQTREAFVNASLAFFENTQGRYDLLLSHSNEVFCHQAAYEIKKRSGLPWMAYFGDPSAKNPYVKYYPIYPFFEEDNQIERLTFEHADRLLFNSTYQRDLMLEGRDTYLAKAEVVPHFFDPDMFLTAPVCASSPCFRLGHFGTLYHVKRKGDILFRAVDRLLQIYPSYQDRFLVELYGPVTDQDRCDHAKMRHPESLSIKGTIPYLESLRRMQQMDALILLDAFFTQQEDGLDHNPFFACKLVEYLGAHKPILGITMPRGPSGDILRESGNLIADQRLDRVAFLLKRTIDQKTKVNFEVYGRFSKQAHVLRLQCIVDELLRQGGMR